MVRARLSGTPAASRLESSRVKFSSIFAETLPEPKLMAGTAAPAEPDLPEDFSERLIGLRPRCSICRKASARPPASSWPSASEPSSCNALYWNKAMAFCLFLCLRRRRRRRFARAVESLVLGGAHDFLGGGDPMPHEPPSVLVQGMKAVPQGHLANLARRAVLEDLLADL